VAEDKTGPSLKDIREYFGMTAKELMAEWPKLSDEDKVQLRTGIADGTHTY
jgi:hypothetical protein